MTIYGVSHGHKLHIVPDGADEAICKSGPVWLWRLYSRMGDALRDPREPSRCKVCFGIKSELPTADELALIQVQIRFHQAAADLLRMAWTGEGVTP